MKIKKQERPINLITDLTSLELATSYYLTHFASGNSNTERAKRNDLSKFFGFACQAQGTTAPLFEQISQSLIERWIDDLLAAGEAQSTIGRRVATVKHFLSSCAPLYGTIDAGRRVRAPEAKKPAPRWLTREEITALRAAVSGLSDEFERARLRLCIELGLDVGLRVAEICNMRAAHLDLDHNMLVNFRRKGRKFDTKPINKTLRAAIDNYMPLREAYIRKHDRGWKLIARENQLMFPLIVSHWCAQSCSPDSWRMNPRTLRRIIAQTCARAGTPYVNPHRLRHSFCKILLDATHDLALVAQAACHSSVETTRRYVTANDEELKAAFEAIK